MFRHVLNARPLLNLVAASPRLQERAPLKAAIASRDAAQAAVIEAAETLARLQAIISASDEAARQAADATRAANDFRNAWVRRGCPLSDTRELQSLIDAAALASRAAEGAAVNADAVQKQMTHAEDAVKSRQVAIGHAEDNITSAISVVIAAEAQPLLAEFEAAAATYRELRERAMAVSLTLGKPSGLDYKNRSNPSAEGEQMVDEHIERAAIESWSRHVNDRRDPEAFLDGLLAPWRARAKALRQDPEC